MSEWGLWSFQRRRLKVELQFLVQQIRQGRTISQVHPITFTVLSDNIVVPFGTGYRGTQPDLPVWRLLVDDICA